MSIAAAIAQSCAQPCALGASERWKCVRWPFGSILHYDADVDPHTEQTGGVHSFEYAILNPQYQQQANSAVVDVGAKVAADFYGGERWVRSCGAVTNTIATNRTDLRNWLAQAATVLHVDDDTYKVRDTEASSNHSISAVVGSQLAGSFTVEVKLDEISIIQISIFNSTNLHITRAYFNLSAGVIGNVNGVSSMVPIGDGWYRISMPYIATVANSTAYIFTAKSGNITNYVGNGTDGFFIRRHQGTATPYPLPYVPPAVTQPASNATATNGMWFEMPDGSTLWDALSGGAMTLASRLRMYVASTDIPVSTTLNLLTPDDVAGRFLTIQKSAGGDIVAALSDGTNTATVAMAAWARGAVLEFVPQVLTGAEEMRIGYKTDAATSITWGTAATYAGTFGPDAVLEKLMVGYNNVYPMGMGELTVWPEAVSDAALGYPYLALGDEIVTFQGEIPTW